MGLHNHKNYNIIKFAQFKNTPWLSMSMNKNYFNVPQDSTQKYQTPQREDLD